MAADFIIRPVSADDAAAVAQIYRPYVENSAVTFEDVPPDAAEMRRRILATTEKYPYLVAVLNGEIIGYVYAGAFKPRIGYRFSVETSIYIKQGFLGHGYGRALYNELEKELKKLGIKNVNACIAFARQPDEHLDNSSRDFHSRLGYTPAGTFHQCAYKFGTWYDMMWMEKFIAEHD